MAVLQYGLATAVQTSYTRAHVQLRPELALADILAACSCKGKQGQAQRGVHACICPMEEHAVGGGAACTRVEQPRRHVHR